MMTTVATTVSEPDAPPSESSDQAAIRGLLDRVKVPTGAACTTAESTRFLQSACRVTMAGSACDSPTAQDIECLRQAAWKYRLETGADKVAATDLMPVLQRLGYV